MLGDLLHLCALLLGQGKTQKTGTRHLNSAGKKGRNGQAKCKPTTVVHWKGPYVCRNVGTDVLKIVKQGKGGERKAIPFAGSSRVTTFFGGQKRWAHRVLPMEEKQVQG